MTEPCMNLGVEAVGITGLRRVSSLEECLMGPLLRKKPFCSSKLAKLCILRSYCLRITRLWLFFLIPSKNTSLSHQIRSSLTWIFDTGSSLCGFSQLFILAIPRYWSIWRGILLLIQTFLLPSDTWMCKWEVKRCIWLHNVQCTSQPSQSFLYSSTTPKAPPCYRVIWYW